MNILEDILDDLRPLAGDLNTQQLVALLNRKQRVLINKVTFNNAILFQAFSYEQTVTAPANGTTATIPAGTWQDGCKITVTDANGYEQVIPVFLPGQVPNVRYYATVSGTTVTFVFPTGASFTTGTIFRLRELRDIIYRDDLQLKNDSGSFYMIRPTGQFYADNALVGGALRYVTSSNTAEDYPITVNTNDATYNTFTTGTLQTVRIHMPSIAVTAAWATIDTATVHPGFLYFYLLPEEYRQMHVDLCKAELAPERYREPAIHGRGVTITRLRESIRSTY